ncbi:hypothetical protein OEZ85_001661 [Tetradesmus obliquus]|uniref:FAD-binding FR-type domain-containing protein n=1 Tax=Tetradesmus obliquus TaxID=3088 RepID=A0ABY8U0S0_TETOB|nr:hypothetical protein OEZ85_001661 [Tetradesmus obliquus]
MQQQLQQQCRAGLRRPQQPQMASSSRALLQSRRPAPWGNCSQRTRRIAVPSAAAAAASTPKVDDEDLMQFPDRYKWYEAKFAADDMPDWIAGRFISSTQQAPYMRLLTFEVEVSRERVPLRNAYKAAGQRMAVRVNGGEKRLLTVASPPHPEELNKEALFLCKGDIFAGETKQAREPTSTMAEVQVLVNAKEAPEVYNMGADDLITVGPFECEGLDMRSSGIQALFRFPTVVIFASGHGIATAAALLESPLGAPTHLSPTLRSDVRVYYNAPNRTSLCLTDRFEKWEEQLTVEVVATTNGFMDAWDGDDTLVYDPEATAAIILTGGDEEAEAAALEVCKEAEVTAIVSDSQAAAPPVYLDSTPKSFLRWRKDPEAEAMAAAAAAADGNVTSEDLTD